ncbi:MAG: MBL fold metallo-hydrolase [Solobacterium sp.]|nr:MBL fold metallo-hydrolase [Solobacterium sp.]
MYQIQNVTEDILWIGASDRRLSRFENLFPVPSGVSYNSYLIKDEKTVIFDTADVTVAEQYAENLKAALDGRKPDYLVILHVEPDHCSQLLNVLNAYPDITLVSSAKAIQMLDQFFPELNGKCERITVKEGDTLETGKHVFRFIAAPMVHWPEVLFAYDETAKILFSADAFGTFGAIDGSIFADTYDYEKVYLDDARRYYANIVGKYGAQVQAALKKAANLDIRMICSLHGPVWRKDLGYLLDKYQLWSTYTAETEDYAVIYGSLYGNTASAAEAAAALIAQKSEKHVTVFDASGTDVSYLIAEIFRAKNIVLFCPTYNAALYPPIEALLNDLLAIGIRNRIFFLGENGSWAPMSAKLMRTKLEGLKDCTICDTVLTIKGALHDTEALETFTDAVTAM